MALTITRLAEREVGAIIVPTRSRTLTRKLTFATTPRFSMPCAASRWLRVSMQNAASHCRRSTASGYGVDLSGAVRAICAAVLEHSDVIYQEILHELRGYEFGITAPLMLLCEALLLRGQLDAVSQMIRAGTLKMQPQ